MLLALTLLWLRLIRCHRCTALHCVRVCRIHFILDEIVMGGMVLETSLKEIIKSVNGTLKYARDTQAQAEQNTKIGRKQNV